VPALALLAVLAVLAGCATPAPAPRPGTPGAAESVPAPSSTTLPPSTRPMPPAPTPLVAEQRWLDEWFRGTPVVISLTDINTLAVDVPLANSFDGGSSNPKPALVAVLDRVATSLRRQPTLRISVAAPPDAAATTAALAATRAQQVRAHLVSRGVPATRVASVGSARSGAPVQLRLIATAQAIGRLDDAALPPTSAGFKPTAATPASGVKR
jgi:outer membrane protein OmpA-like peptidoglycan-associated protein